MDWKEQLQEAKDLFESGIISQEDFEELKEEVLRKRNTLISYGLIEATPDLSFPKQPQRAKIPAPAQSGGGSFQLDLVYIPAGTFMMGVISGSEDPHRWAKPQHKVEITRDFYITKYHITQSVWKEVMGNNPSDSKGDNHPVTNLTWFQMVEFCNVLSEREGKERVYTINGENVTCNWDAKGYRLPTESEWEYCARAGESHHYAGSNNVDEVAWHKGNSGRKLHPVGQKKPNAWGLYDMSGNACDKVWDFRVDDEYRKRPSNVKDPKGPSKVSSGTSRGFRGGAYREAIVNQQCCYRNGVGAKHAQDYISFRVVILA